MLGRLDRGVKLAVMHGQPDHAERWSAVADEIKADILEHGVDERGVFTQRYGHPALDASNLLIPLLRFLPSDDPRVRATVLAIADELTEHGLVLRYRVEDTDDGLSGEEGAFTICSFWLVSALVEIGEVERASTLCRRLLDFASPLKLYAEEIDLRPGSIWETSPRPSPISLRSMRSSTSSAPKTAPNQVNSGPRTRDTELGHEPARASNCGRSSSSAYPIDNDEGTLNATTVG